MSGHKLPRSFYEGDDVVKISQKLLGKVLCTHIDGQHTSGMIVETEAYNGRTDRACHAFGGVRTKRTETMYGPGGRAYIYLCYGIHHLFNVVTNRKDFADAILIRAVKPVKGIEIMKERRGPSKKEKEITNGPGKLSQALGITTELDNTDLAGNTIWIEDRNTEVSQEMIEIDTRVGVEYAGEDAKRLWRFSLKQSKFVSK